MKKIYNTLVMMAIVAMTATFTSCDEDIDIANSLEGTWTGTMYVYTSYNGHDYYATRGVPATGWTTTRMRPGTT